MSFSRDVQNTFNIVKRQILVKFQWKNQIEENKLDKKDGGLKRYLLTRMANDQHLKFGLDFSVKNTLVNYLKRVRVCNLLECDCFCGKGK